MLATPTFTNFAKGMFHKFLSLNAYQYVFPPNIKHGLYN